MFYLRKSKMTRQDLFFQAPYKTPIGLNIVQFFLAIRTAQFPHVLGSKRTFQIRVAPSRCKRKGKVFTHDGPNLISCFQMFRYDTSHNVINECINGQERMKRQDGWSCKRGNGNLRSRVGKIQKFLKIPGCSACNDANNSRDAMPGVPLSGTTNGMILANSVVRCVRMAVCVLICWDSSKIKQEIRESSLSFLHTERGRNVYNTHTH